MHCRRVQHASVPRPPGQDAHQQAVSFYSGVLGLEEIPKPATFTQIDVSWFRVGPDEVHVYAVDEDEPPPHQGAHFCLEVDDLPAARAALESAGCACEVPEPIPNRPRFVTRDPFGNLIEFTAIHGDYLLDEPTDRAEPR